ncbi:MAG: CCA tRNA nucleotidyltransferase [Lentisphaerae bacterium]|nr:CCA tRNA nucleotidyltransferase [Lentisphaerota bacterium]
MFDFLVRMSRVFHIACPEGDLFAAAGEVTGRLRRAGFMTYWVGGAARDLYMQRTPADVDMVTVARPDEVKRIFPDAEMVGACFGVVLVKHRNQVFEIATCREERAYGDGRRPDEVKFTDDFVLDLQRRDFTCNAMLYDPAGEQLIDYLNGVNDIDNSILRVVGCPRERFQEDHLRLFRAVRFASKLGFELEEECQAALREMAGATAVLAAERVRQELENMLTGADPVRALELLKNSGLLKVWLPEVDALAGVEQYKKYHPEGDVWQHTLLMFQNARKPLDAALAWSILLHDIGKKPTFSCGEDNIPHFYCHEQVGADMVKDIAGRLRFSGAMADTVEHAVRNHMRFASVCNMRTAKLRRLLAEADFVMELELHRLDCLSSNQLMGTWEFLQARLQSFNSTALPEPLITGRDLIALGLTPGAEFKTILNAVMDAQLEGVLQDKASAIEWVIEKFDIKK